MLSKMLLKIMCFLEYRFGRFLGMVLGGFWESKNLDFRIFLDVFSKQKSNSFWKPQKIRKNTTRRTVEGFLGRPGGMRGLPGREKERGEKPQDVGDIGRILDIANIKH